MATAMGRKAAPARNIVAFRSYQSRAETLVKTYLLADPFIPYTSVFAGIFACKMVMFIDHISFIFLVTIEERTSLFWFKADTYLMKKLYMFLIFFVTVVMKHTKEKERKCKDLEKIIIFLIGFSENNRSIEHVLHKLLSFAAQFFPCTFIPCKTVLALHRSMIYVSWSAVFTSGRTLP